MILRSGFIFAAIWIGLQTAKAETSLSEAAMKVITLHQELTEFKNDPEFHNVGFAICCRFNHWLKEVDKLTDQSGIELISEVGFLPGDLRQLGMEYMRSRGHPTSYSKWMESTIEAGQSPN